MTGNRKSVQFLTSVEFGRLTVEERLAYLHELERAAHDIREQVLRGMMELGRHLMDER